MEEKLKRESKVYLDKLFKRHDPIEAGAIAVDKMKLIVEDIVPDFNHEEFEEIVQEHLKVHKYTALNKETKQFEVHMLKDTIDFPSAMAIVVHFLKKMERRNTNSFAGKGLIRFSDFGAGGGGAVPDPLVDLRRRLY